MLSSRFDKILRKVALHCYVDSYFKASCECIQSGASCNGGFGGLSLPWKSEKCLSLPWKLVKPALEIG